MTMQTIYKCNRCGKAHTSPSDSIPDAWINAGSLFGPCATLHLCDACAKQLREWFNPIKVKPAPPTHNFQTIAVRVEISIDDASPAVFECLEDRGLIDLSKIHAQTPERYARAMLYRIEQLMSPAVLEAMRRARLLC